MGTNDINSLVLRLIIGRRNFIDKLWQFRVSPHYFSFSVSYCFITLHFLYGKILDYWTTQGSITRNVWNICNGFSNSVLPFISIFYRNICTNCLRSPTHPLFSECIYPSIIHTPAYLTTHPPQNIGGSMLPNTSLQITPVERWI